MFKKFNQFNYSCFYVSNFLNKNCVIPNYSINTIHNYSTKTKLANLLGIDIESKTKIITEKYIYNQKWMKSLNWKFKNVSKFNYTFITYDIESYTDESGKVIPYLLGIYSEIFGYKVFYGDNCIIDGIDFLLNYNFSKHKINKIDLYAHNGGNFDLLLIIKNILNNKIESIKYIENSSNSIILFSFKYNDVKYIFKDSYALIPLSLNKLLKSFNIKIDNEIGKLTLDHNWVTKDKINYIGPKPEWLINYKQSEFNFKDYVIKYNKIDCIGLYNVIISFNNLIINTLNIDISNSLTLPQAAMKIFRSKYLNDDNKIRLFSNKTFDFINNSYHGGCVSVYKPYGKNLYYYDINSLYPFVMLKDMPVGKPIRYDINKGLNSLFGFAFAKIECPKDLNIPVLPLKVEIAGKETLIFPTGSFKGYYFSEELKYAESLGYKIKLIRAIEFKRDHNLFEEYISEFYKLKLSSNSGLKIIGKLFLNTLYGRFGIHRNVTSNIIVNTDEDRKKIEQTFSNITATQLNENTTLYNYNMTPNPNLYKENPELFEKINWNNLQLLENKISNIAIASAITAYARIEIDGYKRLPGIDVYYSDTDSIIISKPLPSKYIGKELGKMKNELGDENYNITLDHQYFIEEGIFLRDKVYSIKLKDGKIITKFSGLNKNYITPELFDILKDIYINNKSTISLETSITYKNKKCMEIINKKTMKDFVFKYYKRIPIYNENIWTNTKPINITSTTLDLLPKIIKETVLSKTKNTTGLVKFNHKINIKNIKPNFNKKYDGMFLSYSSEILDNSKLSKEYLLDELKNIIKRINFEDHLLIKGIGFLITEEYKNDRNKKTMKTISFMESYENISGILNVYSEHLTELLESDIQSGNFLNNSTENNLRKLHLRIRIPDEYKQQLKTHLKEPKVPSTIINKLPSKSPISISNESISDQILNDEKLNFLDGLNQAQDNILTSEQIRKKQNITDEKIADLINEYKELSALIKQLKIEIENEPKPKKRRKSKTDNELKLCSLEEIKNEIYLNINRYGVDVNKI